MYAHNTKIYTRHQVPKSQNHPKGYKYLEMFKQEYRKLKPLKYFPFSICPKSIVDALNKNNKKANKKNITRSKLPNLKESPCCNVHMIFHTQVFRSFEDESNYLQSTLSQYLLFHHIFHYSYQNLHIIRFLIFKFLIKCNYYNLW
jgi:hypothetical protein